MASQNEPDLVMMTSADYFYTEDEGHAKICVMRVGDCVEELKVSYETVKDKGVLASDSKDFKTVKGTLTFKPGDRLEYFDVPLLADATWETMEKFEVTLVAIEKGTARFGKLIESTVYLVDDDVYPRPPPKGQEIHTGYTQLWGFIKERWAARHPKPIKSLLCIFWETIHGLLGTFILKYFLDNILIGDTETPKPLSTLEDYSVPIILAGIYVASAWMVWKLYYKFVDIRGNSGTRKDLRNWLMRKYLWFSEKEHVNAIKNSVVANALISNVEEVVQCCWFTHYLLIAAIFDLLCNTAYAIYLDWHAVLPIVIMGPFIALTLKLRGKKLKQLVQIRQGAEDSWIEIMDEAMDNWRLIAGHKLQDHVAGKFKKDYDQFYKKHRKSRFYQTDTEFIPQFFNEFLLGGILVYGAFLNAKGSLSVGTFAALITIFRKIGSMLLVVSQSLIKMQRGTIALNKICNILNAPTGVEDQLKVSHEMTTHMVNRLDADMTRRASTIHFANEAFGQVTKETESDHFAAEQMMMGKFTEKLKAKVRKTHVGSAYKIIPIEDGADTADTPTGTESKIFTEWFKHTADLARIRFREVQFEYATGGGHDSTVPLLQHCNMNIPLGVFMVVVSNGKASGMLTMMKLLGRYLYPTKGAIEIPAHLKVILVDQEPLLLDSTLLENLVFGNKGVTEDYAWEVAKGLGISKTILDNPQRSTLQVGDRGCNLKLVDRQVVSIARSIIANPNLLLLNKMESIFNEEHRDQVFSYLADWRTRGNSPFSPKQEVIDSRTIILNPSAGTVNSILDKVDVVLKMSQIDGQDKFTPEVSDARMHMEELKKMLELSKNMKVEE